MSICVDNVFIFQGIHVPVCVCMCTYVCLLECVCWS